MRYVLAIVSLAISGVLLLLGIGQRTFLAGPAELVYPIVAEADAPYAVLDGSELAKVSGQANVVLRGETAFTALANTRDAAAWLEPFDHAELTVDAATQTIVSAPVAGKAPASDSASELLTLDEEGKPLPIDPRGSDLWLEERADEAGITRMPVSPTNDQSIIIAGTGEEPIPKGASLVWVQDRATPWAGPLLVSGGVFAVLGVILQLLAFDRDKRALGPRRGRRGPLLGVRNVLSGSGRRAKKALQTEEAPRRGSFDNTPGLSTDEAIPDQLETPENAAAQFAEQPTAQVPGEPGGDVEGAVKAPVEAENADGGVSGHEDEAGAADRIEASGVGDTPAEDDTPADEGVLEDDREGQGTAEEVIAGEIVEEDPAAAEGPVIDAEPVLGEAPVDGDADPANGDGTPVEIVAEDTEPNDERAADDGTEGEDHAK